MLFSRFFARIAHYGAAGLLLSAFAANAETVISPGGKPGAAKSWAANGGVITLDLVPGFTPDAVAAAIQKGVAGSKASVKDGKVIVSGVDEKKLLAALEKIDVAADDVDAMVAALQGGGEEGSGSSIRATKAAEIPQPSASPAAEEAVGATVISLKHGKYPHVAITLKLDKIPKSLADAGVKAGKEVTVVPRVNLENGKIAPADDRSKANVGAWYARPGDKVQVAIEGQNPQGFWVASRFERAPR